MRSLVLVWVAALSLAGCSCEGEPQTNQGGGVLKVLENQLLFGEVCPKPTDPALSVEPITKQLHIQNDGNALLYINELGVEASRADVFVVNTAQVPATLDPGAEAAIDITFTPKESGAIAADLTVRGEGDPIVVKLQGTGKSLPPNPSLSMSCPGGGLEGIDTCSIAEPYLFFLPTPKMQTAEMALTVKNGGCPTLHLTGIKIETDTSEGASETTFALAQGQPTEVFIAGGGSEQIKVQFTPELSTTILGTLSFETNIPSMPSVSLPLKGTGTEPVLSVTTEIGCGYPDPSARPYCCDFKSKSHPCTGLFTLHNSGDEPLKITRVYLQSGSAMFELADTSGLIDQEIGGLSELTDAIQITYRPASAQETDRLIIESSGGNTYAELRGGSPPVLDTYPDTFVNFGTNLEPTEAYWMPVNVLNLYTYNEQVDLTVRGVEIEQDERAAFSLGSSPDCTPDLNEGGVLARGTSGTICLKLQPTINGGSFSGMLVIKSDDPMYDHDADPSREWYRLEISGETKCNPAPVAAISVPIDGATCQSDTQCSALQFAAECVDDLCHAVSSPYGLASSAGGTLVLSGATSHDLTPDPADNRCTVENRGEIATWTWTLLSKPPASSGSITEDPTGHTPTTTLTFDKAGVYQLGLVVTDQTGLASPAANFEVNVTSSN